MSTSLVSPCVCKNDCGVNFLTVVFSPEGQTGRGMYGFGTTPTNWLHQKLKLVPLLYIGCPHKISVEKYSNAYFYLV